MSLEARERVCPQEFMWPNIIMHLFQTWFSLKKKISCPQTNPACWQWLSHVSLKDGRHGASRMWQTGCLGTLLAKESLGLQHGHRRSPPLWDVVDRPSWAGTPGPGHQPTCMDVKGGVTHTAGTSLRSSRRTMTIHPAVTSEEPAPSLLFSTQRWQQANRCCWFLATAVSLPRLRHVVNSSDAFKMPLAGRKKCWRKEIIFTTLAAVFDSWSTVILGI